MHTKQSSKYNAKHQLYFCRKSKQYKYLINIEDNFYSLKFTKHKIEQTKMPIFILLNGDDISRGLQTHQGGIACWSLGQNNHAEEAQQELPI